MIKTYLPYEPDQQLLLPAALQEWLPDDHLAYFISDVVGPVGHVEGHRSLRAGTARRAAVSSTDDGQGVALYCVGVASSRRIARRLHEDIAFRVLAANNRTSGPSPTFARIMWMRCRACSYRYWLCQQAGLVKLGHVALDGTKVKANASKHKAMSYQRMKEKAAQLAAEVAELLRQAQAADDEEDRRYGKDKAWR